MNFLLIVGNGQNPPYTCDALHAIIICHPGEAATAIWHMFILQMPILKLMRKAF